MNDDPIREEQSIFSRVKEWFNKHIFKTVTPPEEYIKSDREEMVDRWIHNSREFQEAISKCGVTAQQMSDGILKFNRVLTPNEMREIMKNREVNRNG